MIPCACPPKFKHLSAILFYLKNMKHMKIDFIKTSDDIKSKKNFYRAKAGNLNNFNCKPVQQLHGLLSQYF